MLKRLLFALSLFITGNCLAQTDEDSAVLAKDTVILDTFNFDLKQFTGKGPYTFIDKKSKATQMVYQLVLQSGDWLYTDKNEVLRVKGSYKVKSEQSIKSGIWEYYDEEGELLMTENLTTPKSTTEYFKPFVLKREESIDIINFNDDEVLEVKRIENPKPIRIASTVYRIDYSNDSLNKFNMDTLRDMDNRNENTWLIADKNQKSIDKSLNLVENGSFEEESGRIDYGLTIGGNIKAWKAAAGTPDYFKSKRFDAMDGDAAIGCRFYTDNWNHIEFISTQLKEVLEANKTYCLKVYVRLKEESFFGVNALGALLSNQVPNGYELIAGEIKPSIKHHGGTVLTYKTKWMQLSCIYKAIGNEEYLTLGSFSNSDSMTKRHLKGSAAEAYYYFDNIQLYEIESADECPCNMGKKEPPPVVEIPEKEVVKKSFVIKNIFFENDKWELLPESYNSLDSLFDVIDDNNFKKIEIAGHTSNTGSRDRNLLLSKNRAEAVKKYLVQKGLSASIFVCKGYGPDNPIADNRTPEGQAENRRVEFTILEE
jgi:OOP family OmpA-OmpF porin